jgi:hypothetical protein
VPELLAEMWKAIGQLLKQAQRVGAVRRDVQLSVVCAAIEQQGSGEECERVVWNVISDGLRPKKGKAG